MKSRSQTFQNLPIDIAGSDTFGRYPKISVTQSFNMILSDNWLVDYAGFKTAIHNINPNGKGRGAFRSITYDCIFAVIGSGVYKISHALSFVQVGTLTTNFSDVFIDEDNQGNVEICDLVNIYYYNANVVPTFGALTLDFTPGYIAFHDSRFLSVDLASNNWRLSDPLAGNRSFPPSSQFVGQFQTKADMPLAVFGVPGRSNQIFLMGSNVTQFWTDVGAALFPYQLQTGANIDYGCISSDTIANIDEIVCWLAGNTQAGPVIMASRGGSVTRLSNDGIDFRLNALTNPQDSHAFMFRQDGHIFYQLTFPTDNFSLAFDFTTNKFFTITDPYMNYHPAKSIVFFNDTYYFVSINDGSLYEMNTSITNYDGLMIPRIRICSTLRAPDTQPFVTNNVVFPIEQGVDSTTFNPLNYPQQLLITEDDKYINTEGITGNFPLAKKSGLTLETELSQGGKEAQQILPPQAAVDLAISNDGGYTFGNFFRQYLNPIGYRKNRFIYYNLGWSNEMTFQFRFWSLGRIVAGNGEMSIYQ